jgi:hypothetical protein
MATASVLSLFLVLASHRAHAADEVQSCVTAADEGQSARRKGALVEARSRFIACVRDECPAPIRSDCVRWLEDVEARTPSISLRIVASDGRDLTGTIRIDGAPVPANDLGRGRSMPLDPGAHVFRAEVSGFEPLARSIVLMEGERARLVTMTLPALDSSAPDLPRVSRRPSPLMWGVGALGVLGLGSFAYFGLTGRAQASDLRSGCGTTQTCDPADVEAVRNKYILADVSLGVGVVALGVATVIWLSTR